jgi:uncharacterized membrane protein YqiK
VEKDTAIEIWRKNLEAEKVQLDVDRQIEFLRLEQSRDVAVRRAQQQAEVARERAERERDAEEAEIRAREEVEKARIAQEKVLESERILREQETERLEVQRRRVLALDEKDRVIAIAQKSKEEAEVQAAVALARAKEAEAEEKVFSTREMEIAERRKKIELILAALQAERESIQLTTIAAAEKVAAEDRAEADRFASLAAKLRYEVDADGKRQLNDAENMRSDASRRSALRMKLVEHLEGIIREAVKPMESIDAIKILQVEGLPGLSGAVPMGGAGGDDSSRDLGGPGGGDGGGRRNGTLADNIVSSALRYRAQAPFVDTLLKEIGMTPNDITNLGNLLQDEREDKSPPEPTAKRKR